MSLYPRHRIDLGAGDVAVAAAALARGGDAEVLARRVEARWSPHAIATLSVRSAFDLLLEALALPPGSELVMSDVTIPHMASIARARGLTVVPVPIEQATAAPSPQALERALTPRTGAVLLAHLFGGRMNLLPLLELCRARRVPLLEDCAQAWAGPRDTGHPGALASFFSFGSIKTATALGGALTCVRDARLLGKMRAAQARLPVLPARAFALKLARGAALAGLGGPVQFGAARAAFTSAGFDFERALEAAVKGFPGTLVQMLDGIRRRPPAAMLRLLEHRMQTWDGRRLEERTALGERLRSVAGARMPGCRQPMRTHWLAPFVADEPAALIASLREAGFDAAQGTTSLVSLSGAARWLSSVVYLPAYAGISAESFTRLLAVIERALPSPWPSPLRGERGCAIGTGR